MNNYFLGRKIELKAVGCTLQVTSTEGYECSLDHKDIDALINFLEEAKYKILATLEEQKQIERERIEQELKDLEAKKKELEVRLQDLSQ